MSDAFNGGGASGSADPNLIQRILAYINGGGASGSADPRARAIQDAQAQLANGPPPNSNQPPTLGPTAPIQSAAQIPVDLSSPAAAPPAAPFQQPAHPSTMRYPMWPTPPAPAAAAPVNIPIGGGPGNVMQAPTGTPAGRVAAHVDPRMRGEVAPATNPGWGLVDRPNMNPGIGGGMLGGALAGGNRGDSGAHGMGMFNFANLFGGGQPTAAAAPSTLPRQKINVGKIPPNAEANVPPSSPTPWFPSSNTPLPWGG